MYHAHDSVAFFCVFLSNNSTNSTSWCLARTEFFQWECVVMLTLLPISLNIIFVVSSKPFLVTILNSVSYFFCFFSVCVHDRFFCCVLFLCWSRVGDVF